MSQDNQITVRGYVTAEPKFWQTTPTQTPVAEIRIGSTPRRLNRATGEWQDADTTYYTVKCWRRLAVNVASSLRKGDMVIIRGKFTSRQWIDDQQRPRVQVEVEADTVGHDLLFGWAHFIRGVQAPRGRSEYGADGLPSPRDAAAGHATGGGEERHDSDEADGLDGDLAGGLTGDLAGDLTGGLDGESDLDGLASRLDAATEAAPVF